MIKQVLGETLVENYGKFVLTFLLFFTFDKQKPMVFMNIDVFLSSYKDIPGWEEMALSYVRGCIGYTPEKASSLKGW